MDFLYMCKTFKQINYKNFPHTNMSITKNHNNNIEPRNKSPNKWTIIKFLILTLSILSISLNIYYYFEVESIRGKVKRLTRFE
jgi:hypothetical protein